ncbi:MAG: XRE family transcriptional regulator [Fimbriimonadaceae bacterium]
MEPVRDVDLDRELLAENIRGWRVIRGFSQEELAARAGVGITTIYKAEQGKVVRRKYLKKIVEDGLDGLLEEANSSPRLSNLKPDDALYAKHARDRTTWYVYGDHRRRVPENNLQLIQDVQERIRLGRLGFATLFGSGLEYLMPNGPGILLYEVHGPTDPVSQNYRDAIYFVLCGSVLLTLKGETVRLDEGESIGCDGRNIVTMDLAEPWQNGQLPPVVQFIGANRIGKIPKPRRRASVAKHEHSEGEHGKERLHNRREKKEGAPRTA